MKKMFICSLIGLSSMANATIEWDTPQGQLKLNGDVEFNVDAASSKQQLSSLKETADKKINRQIRIVGISMDVY